MSYFPKSATQYSQIYNEIAKGPYNSVIKTILGVKDEGYAQYVVYHSNCQKMRFNCDLLWLIEVSDLSSGQHIYRYQHITDVRMFFGVWQA